MRSLGELKISRGGQGVTEDDLRGLEERIGFKLPGAYQELLKHSNGGHPELDTFPHEDGEWSVNNFFTLGDDASTESIWWNYCHRWPEATPNLLPFARDGGGNLFCLELGGDGNAPVIVWAHDIPPPQVLQLADSFEEFVDGLQENPDYI
jgi:cell wall assembly regulator SMI1